MMRVCLIRKRALLSLTLLLLLVAALAALYAASKSKSSSPSPLKASPSAALARHCGFRGNFVQADVDAACATAGDHPTPCRVTRINHLDQSGFVESRLRLRTGSTLRIFVYPPSDLISGHIIRRGSWEGATVALMTMALRAWPGSALVDIGSGVGVYSLQAARVGRKVLAIDANYQNAIRLAKSVHSNSYTGLVHVYWNAISTQPDGTGLYMRHAARDCNVGGWVPSNNTPAPDATDGIRVRAAGLDQLKSASSVHLSGVTGLFLKLDIEGQEWNALATGKRMFDATYPPVPLVLMEWTGIRRETERATLALKFFAFRRYLPYSLVGGGGAPVPTLRRLQPKDWRLWPGDIVWAKNLTQLIDSWR